MAMQHHIGSFRPTPLKRVLAFMGLSLAIHVVLVGATSVGYLLRDESAPDGADGAQVEVDATTADPSAAPSTAPEPAASSELPQRSQPKDATEVYMERQGGGEEAAANPDTLELFE